MNSLVRGTAWILGITLIAIGLLGFVQNPVLGLFDADTLQSIIHLSGGIVGIAAVLSGESFARLYLIILGFLFTMITVLGFLDGSTVLGLFAVNDADNYLHAAVAILGLGIGFGAKK